MPLNPDGSYTDAQGWHRTAQQVARDVARDCLYWARSRGWIDHPLDEREAKAQEARWVRAWIKRDPSPSERRDAEWVQRFAHDLRPRS